MQLEHYFDFLGEDDIRLKDTRIGIETILSDYLELGLFAEQIASRYRTLSLEQVYATLTYYWHNQVEMDGYLQRTNERNQVYRQQALTQTNALRERLQKRASTYQRDAI